MTDQPTETRQPHRHAILTRFEDACREIGEPLTPAQLGAIAFVLGGALGEMVRGIRDRVRVPQAEDDQ